MKNINYEITISNIRKHLKDYLLKNKLKSLILGVSGGIDSALVAALAYPVVKEIGIELIGRSITIETNKSDEILRAENIGKNFCTNFKEINLTEEFNIIKNSLSDTDIIIDSEKTDFLFKIDRENKIRLGNVKARLRMIHLYDLAQKNKGLVLSTDNYTEYLLGFWTLHGDVGDYGLIQELWKTEVYAMTEWIANNENLSENASESLKSMLDALATDGLGITNSDLDQILPDWKDKYTTTRQGYEEVDLILEYYITNYGSIQGHPVIKRHINSDFKRKIPINLKREEIFF